MGINVSKYNLDVVLLHEGQRYYRVVGNNEMGFQQLCTWITANGCQQAHICMKATGQCGYAAAEFFYRSGHDVSVVNPARIKAYSASRLKRNKTYKVDAVLIAEFCQREKPTFWSPPRAVFSALKALVHHLNDLKTIKR